MSCVIAVDNSNLFIEGQKASGVRKGLSTQDYTWRLDFAGLLAFMADGRDIHKAFLVGSKPPPQDTVWTMAENGGFEVITHDRNSQNKEKAIDTEVVAQATLAIARGPEKGVLVLGSGDSDFLPLVKVAHECGWTVELVAFHSSFSPVGNLAKSVDKIRTLDGSLDNVGHCVAPKTGTSSAPA
ncbi:MULTISPECIES: NYN domain-containing protein [Brucella]|uniref:NYN domain-containing protein n=1 Tax=Brucella TaxID=234 RepID=UPI0007C6EB12|nr:MULTISPECIES: NYN domain-containing protein [Brucella]MDX4074565.1 NYN domain-containing protein [Brucella sp. NBRC 113783]OAE39607.1 hypothetical protein A7J42_13925 [Brucella intermedia]